MSVVDSRGTADRLIAHLPPRLRWAAGSARLTLQEPVDGLDRVRIRLREQTGRGKRHHPLSESDPVWHERLHQQLRMPWPCVTTRDFDELWTAIVADVAGHGLELGRRTYGGWDDGDPGLARAVWCLLSHLKPGTVVETGVARGVTSRVILEWLAQAGAGHLWSIDLPAMDPALHDQIGVAVPPPLRDRWTYLPGTSRRRLPDLLARVGPIDLFVHDSSHTERNLRFELEHAWDALGCGAVVADDIHAHRAFERFIREHPAAPAYIVAADDGHAQFGIVLKNLDVPTRTD